MSQNDSSSDDESSLSQKSSASHNSKASSLTFSSKETTVSLNEQNRRQAEQLKKLKRQLKQLQNPQLAPDSSSFSQPSAKKTKKEKRHSQNNGAQIQLNLAPKPKVLEMKNGKLNSEMVQNHGNSLISWAVGNNATLNRDALTNLFSPEVQGLIIAKYKRYLQKQDDPESCEQDIFSLDLEEFIRILSELFPHSTEQDTLSIIRSSKDFKDNWYTFEEPLDSIEKFLTRLFGQRLNMLKNGRYPEGNGTVCSEEEFPALRTAILAKILPSATISEADENNSRKKSIFLTNRMLVDTIKQDLPEDLLAFYNAILQVATTIVAHREVARKLHWLHENDKRKEDSDKQSWKNKSDKDKKRKYSDDKQNNAKDENPKKKTTDEKDKSSSSSSSAPVSTYKGKNPKPKCEKCRHHHDKDTKCPKKKQHTWNNKDKKSHTKETN